MGTFSVEVTIEGPQGDSAIVDALVDTGATYMVLPRAILARLGAVPTDRMSFRLADERIVEYDLGEVTVQFEGRSRTMLVVFGPDGAAPLLGATTLELFGLAVNTVEQRLMPVPGLLK